MKTARYHKKCFDQIEGITASNKKLMAEMEHLRHRLEAAIHEKVLEVEETMKVERTAKRLVTEVQVSFASPPGLAV